MQSNAVLSLFACCSVFAPWFATIYHLRAQDIDLNQLFGYRMNKFNVSGMQTNTAIQVGAREAVFQIAF